MEDSVSQGLQGPEVPRLDGHPAAAGAEGGWGRAALAVHGHQGGGPGG